MQFDDARRIVHLGLLVIALGILGAAVVLRRRGQIERRRAWWTGVVAALIVLAQVLALLG